MTFPGCETIKCWHLRRKKQSRNNRSENSLAALTVSSAGWRRAQELLAQTHTPTVMLAFGSCASELRAQGMCAHTCACTPWQGCVILGSSYRQHVWVGSGCPDTALHPPQPHLAPAAQGSGPGGHHVLGPVTVLKGNLQILVLKPSQKN